MPTIVLTTGTSWSVPADWNSSNNTIHCLGAGGQGSHSGGVWGGGAAGGAYARRANVVLTPSGTASYQIGVAGGTTGAGTTFTGNTWFKDASTCVAAGGASTTIITGATGSSTNCVGDQVYAGGSGANGVAGSTTGGGGGAAGLNGAGGNASGTTSGNGDAGTGGAAVSGAAGGTTGNAGTEWPGGVGSGSGAGGQTANQLNPSVGGAYGGGASGTAGAQTTFGLASGGLIVIVYTTGPAAPTLFYPVEQPAVPRAPSLPVINPAMRTSFGISVAGPLFLPIPPAVTPSAWFDMAQAISLPGFPGRTMSNVLSLRAALASMTVVGLVPPIYVPPPIPGRLALPQFYFVPLDEIVMNINLLINGVNANFLALGVDPHLLIPTFAFIGADELTESVNALITAANNQFHAQGLPVAQDIRLFTTLDPNDATLALNTLANEFTANLVHLFGS